MAAADLEKLSTLSNKCYKDQAIWFLNAYWRNFAEAEAENVWRFVESFSQLDSAGKDGNELEELLAHRFLEKVNQTMTVVRMREVLREMDVDRNRKLSLTEFLMYNYVSRGVTLHDLVSAPQCDTDDGEIIKAQQLVDESQRTLGVSRVRLEEAKQALADVTREEAAFRRLLTSKEKEVADLEASGAGPVSLGRRKHELAELKSIDPLPLRTAKIKCESAHRRAEDARVAAEAALDAAERFLAEVSKLGSCKGRLWWMDRELREVRRYLPASRGGIVETRGRHA
eukprot:gnl/Spiro4/16403_TR8810_c0_g1_i1.p1 gnl/Spiro4/16403_TR8810_c0_g1~~gnl/Spiro4/16403_TR8810_c0_g1_i1.p1  ORF type:complete len:293 (+),score=74.29 gnl/Spiro4/16403_TR8810_c0_g1_i1:30-881(+)